MADTTKMKKTDGTFGEESRKFGEETRKQGELGTSGGFGEKSSTRSGEGMGSGSTLSGASLGKPDETGGEQTRAGGIGDSVNEVKDNVKSFVSGKARNLMDQVGVENWDDVKDGARQAVAKARDLASDVANRAQEQATHAVDNVGSMVRRYPFQSVLIGFGVGCLLGAALSASRRAA